MRASSPWYEARRPSGNVGAPAGTHRHARTAQHSAAMCLLWALCCKGRLILHGDDGDGGGGTSEEGTHVPQHQRACLRAAGVPTSSAWRDGGRCPSSAAVARLPPPHGPTTPTSGLRTSTTTSPAAFASSSVPSSAAWTRGRCGAMGSAGASWPIARRSRAIGGGRGTQQHADKVCGRNDAFDPCKYLRREWKRPVQEHRPLCPWWCKPVWAALQATRPDRPCSLHFQSLGEV